MTVRESYIVGARADWAWFVALPVLAVMIGLISERWLSGIAIASFALWVTAPHHFATWLRAYGSRADRRRWREPLTLGPIALGLVTLAGIQWAPITLLMTMWVWDHQHSIMQQYGIARILDRKARSDAPAASRFDLGINWILYVNLMLVSPLYSDFWVRELYRFGAPLSAATLTAVQQASWAVTAASLVAYLAYLGRAIGRGHVLSPIKYAFLTSSYFLWYSTAWWMESIIAAKVAHMIMHGAQYIVVSHAFLRKGSESQESLASWLVQPGRIGFFLLACLAYAVVYQLVTAQPLAVLSFGALSLASDYSASIDALGKSGYTERQSYELVAVLVIQVAAVLHYYLDSFIWKTDDEKTRGGL